MLLHRNTGVNNEYKDAEDNEGDENDKQNMTGRRKAIRQKKSVWMS